MAAENKASEKRRKKTMNVLIIACSQAVLNSILSLIRSGGFEAAATTSDDDAVARIESGNIGAVVIGGGVQEESRRRIRSVADPKQVAVIDGALGDKNVETYVQQDLLPALRRVKAGWASATALTGGIIKTLLVFAFATSFVAIPAHAQLNTAMCSGFDKAAKLPLEQDAVSVAPRNHRVIFENEDMRVLEVTVQPGERENLHHHRWPSVLVVDAWPKIVNYDKDGNEIKPAVQAPGSPEMPIMMRVPPQMEAHSIHNVDSKPFHAVRIEYKKACPVK